MKSLFRLLAVASAALFISGSALAQVPGAVTSNAFAVGQGPGTNGFASVLCTQAQIAIGQSAAKPICAALSGDVTMTAAGVTAIGATKVTSAMLNADVFSTAHSWGGVQTLAAPVFTGIADEQGTLKLSSFVTSTQLAASANDYTATNGSNTCTTKTSLRISTSASWNISGLSCGQAEGDIRIVHNVGAFPAVLTNQDAGSTAANRFLFGSNLTLAADTSVTLRYDGVASRWRAITTPGSGGGGGITGPGTSTNTGVPRWNGTGGSALLDSGVLIDGSNNVTLPALVGVGASWLASVDLRLYSSSRTVVERYENDQNLSIGTLIGNSTYFGKNASGTSLQWAGITAGVDDCRFKVSLGGAPCAANEASAGTETGAWYLGISSNGVMSNALKANDDGVFVLGARNLFINTGQGVVVPDGSRTLNYVLSYNSGASAAFTVTIASPAVFTSTAHGLSINDVVYVTTTGALPTGLTASTVQSSTVGKSTTAYYVIAAGYTANAFELSATVGGTAINTSGSQSGVHTFVQGTNEVDIQSCNNVGNSCAANTSIWMITNASGRKFGVQNINGQNIGVVTSKTHMDAQGVGAVVPTNGCTGANLNGDDHAGRVVTTSTSCTLTFGTAYINQITSCVVTFRSGSRTYSCSASGITVSGLGGGSEIFDYVVHGN